jgi:hypothetical protein
MAYADFVLDFAQTDRVFPNATVPVAAYLGFYRTDGMEFDVREFHQWCVRPTASFTERAFLWTFERNS